MSAENTPTPSEEAMEAATSIAIINSVEENAAIIDRHFAALRERVGKMCARVHHGEYSDNCPFCLTKPQSPGVPDPVCQLCNLESDKSSTNDRITSLEGQVKEAKALERIEKNLGIMAPNGDARAIAIAALTALREAGVKTEEGT